MKNKILLTAILPFFIASCSLIPSQKKSDTVDSASSTSGSCDGSGYKVNGKSYSTLSSAKGYRADGTAQVYTNKDQGSQTASCENFDLNGFTAAHRTLPLPSHVKITNKNNNKSVVVKVNDRGPSSASSLIAVTPAVANLLGASAAFPVHIEAITTAKMTSSSSARPAAVTRSRRIPGYLRKVSKPINRINADRYYIIVGTYTSRDQAFDRFVRVSSIGLQNAAMESRKLKGQTMHMVRLGPYYDQDQIDNAKDRLKNDGLIKFKVVKN